MNSSTQFFVQRQVRRLLERDEPPREILARVLPLSLSEVETHAALGEYDKTQSITAALAKIKLLDIEPEILQIIVQHEKFEVKNLIFGTFTGSDQLIEKTYDLLHLRLSSGLSYVLLLLVTATGMFYLITHKVLTQFAEIFASFGSQLPGITQAALKWQGAYLSPVNVAFLLMALVVFLLVQARSLAKNRSSSWLFRRMPFLRKVFSYTESLQYLSRLKMLTTSGVKLEKAFTALQAHATTKTQLDPPLRDALLASEKIQTTAAELDYQIDRLSLRAEKIVADASRNLIAVIMIMVVSFVAFILFASYLPIFQLGSNI